MSRRLLVCVALICVPLLVVSPASRWLVVLPLMLFAPGIVVERMVRFPVPVPWIVRPAFWLATSLSLLPLIYAWTWLVDLRLGVPLLVLYLGGCTIAAGFVLWRDDSRSDTTASPRWITGIAAASIGLCTLARRWYEIRNDVLPFWVDSVHHAVLVRVVAEQGTIPIDVRPYLPVSELPYHWGFHVVIGSILRLSELDLASTLLWSGQVLNALQILAVAALAAYVWRSSVAGLVAALIVGLVSLMPAYLVTWGRYTLLDGLLVLPPLVIATLAGLRSTSWRPWLLAAILTGGLLCIHYIVSVFALVLLSLLFVWHLAADNRPPIAGTILRHAVKMAGRLIFALAGGALLAAPWLLVLSRRVFVRYAQNPNELRGGGSYNALSEGLLWAGQNRLLFALAVCALLVSVWRRRTSGLYLAAWPLLLLLLANLSFIGLPVLWILTNTEVLVSLYIPVAALIGGGAALVWQSLDARNNAVDRASAAFVRRRGMLGLSFGQWMLVVGIATGAFIAERRLGDVINPATRIAGAADVAAIDWISANTPPDARILTAATLWLPDAERGADGGWWVVPLAKRWSSTPPVLFTYAPPAEVAVIQQRTRALANLKAGEEVATIERIVEANDIGYVYVGTSPNSFKAAWFDNNPRYKRVYERDGVLIFARQP